MNSKASIGGFFFALVIGLLSLASDASAQPGERGGMKGGRGGRDPYAQLALTADQQTRIAAIRSQFEQDTKSLRDQMDAIHEQMHTARENNDAARIEQLRAQSEPLHTRMKAAHDRMDQQIRSLLTAEQITKLDTMRAGKGKGGKGRGGKRRGQEGTVQQQSSGV